MAYVVKFKYTKDAANTPVAITGDFDNTLATQLASAQDAAGITQEWTVSEFGFVNEWVYTAPSKAVWQTFVVDHLHPAIAANNTVFTEQVDENTENAVQMDIIIIDEDGNETTNPFGTVADIVSSLAGS